MSDLRDTLTVLRSLDPAAADVDPHGPRARADLARILASMPPVPKRRRPPVRRLAAAGAAIAALAAGVAVLFPLTSGDPAFATWTPTPAVARAGESAQAAAACRDSQQEGAGAPFRQELSASKTAVAERRGAWSLVLLAGQRGFSALCITDESTPLFKSSFGHVGAPTDYEEPAPRSVSAYALGTGSIDGRELSVAVGAAGSAVTGVVYRSDRHGAVSATVAGGHFAFWLPGGELERSSSHGVPVEVTYRDGTTETRTLSLD